MTNLPALPTLGTLTLSNGDTLKVPVGGLASMLGKAHGPQNEANWRFMGGQPRDAFRPGSNRFYLKRSVPVFDDKGEVVKDSNGKNVYQTEIIGPLGKKIPKLAADGRPMLDEEEQPIHTFEQEAYLIGYTLNRANGVYDSATNKYVEYCRSENFFEPDAKWRGKELANMPPGTIAHRCATIENGTIKDICPAAKWGGKKDGKSIPPKCSKVYIVCIALDLKSAKVLNGDGKPYMIVDEDGNEKIRTVSGLVLAEVYMRSASAKDGMTVVQKIGKLLEDGKPAWTHPIKFGVKEVTNQANAMTAQVLEDRVFNPEGATSDDEIEWYALISEQLHQHRTRWDDTLNFRSERAERVWEEQNGAAPSDAQAASVAAATARAPKPQQARPQSKAKIEAPVIDAEIVEEETDDIF